MITNKKNIYVFDIIRFILSLLVVQIHIGMFSTYSYVIDDIIKNWIGMIAVPLYFMISSYLLFKKIDMNNLFSVDNIRIYKKYFMRLILLYFSWGIIYFVCLQYFYDVDILNFLTSFFFVGFYRQFWFLVAQIFGTFLLLSLLRTLSLNVVIIISCILYCIGLMLVPYNSIFVNIFSFIPHYNGDVVLCRNFLTFGLLYISLGMYFARNKINFTVNKKCKLLLLVLVIVSFSEFLYLKAIGCSYYALQFVIPFIACVIFKLVSLIELKARSCYLLLRKYSVLIFSLHTLVYLFLKKFLSFSSLVTNSLFMYSITILVCILISHIIMFIDEKVIKIRFLY